MYIHVQLIVTPSRHWNWSITARGHQMDEHHTGGGHATPEEALRECLASIHYSSAVLPEAGEV